MVRTASGARWLPGTLALLLSTLLIGTAAAAEPEGPPEPGKRTAPTRIDFDDRLIQGQSNTSGAVYLLERKETPIRSMVRTRLTFRHLTIRTIYDR